jgi:hypothetical protein
LLQSLAVCDRIAGLVEQSFDLAFDAVGHGLFNPVMWPSMFRRTAFGFFEQTN